MKNFVLVVLVFLSGLVIQAQNNVGINATGNPPDASAGLDVNFSNKGLLIPRIALISNDNASPVSSPATSLIVYNTASSGSGATAVVPGYYYWSGSKWIHLSDVSSENEEVWKLTGNTGLSSTSNFIGTIDSADLDFKTFDTIRMNITANGDMGIGTTAPDAMLDIYGTNNKLLLTYDKNNWDRTGASFHVDANGDLLVSTQKTTGATTFRNILLCNETGGFVGIGTDNPGYRLDLPSIKGVNGEGRATAWNTYSDKRIKSDLQTIPYGLKEVMKIEPLKYFQHNSVKKNGGIEISSKGGYNIGIIAQDLYKIVPYVVEKPKNEEKELWSVDYSKLVPVLIKAIQEQEQERVNLQKEVTVLKQENQQLIQSFKLLQKQIDELNNKVNESR